MKPIKTIEVIPFLPPELECLKELAYNLRWSWDHETVSLFQRLDKDLWEKAGHNPVLMLGMISQEKLAEAASDDSFLAHLNRICENYQSYMLDQNHWYKKALKEAGKTNPGTIAYFSAEFGLSEALPIYSGGLGILSGDHVKSASELGVNLVGVGLVYQQGYFRQYLTPDGWQQERYPINDFYNLSILPVRDKDGNPVTISVELPGRNVYARIWKAQVGRVALYLLDTNTAPNTQEDQDITDALYHADRDIRIKQEIFLGVGGLRALKAVGIEPTVCHLNEGHSAFLGLERIRMMMQEKKLTFWEALEAAKAGQIFTTHTPVPAGIDKFDPQVVEKYFRSYWESVGISREDFMGLGRSNPQDNTELFSMATLAIKLSSRINAVSKLHGVVSRKLFTDIYPNVPEHEVPISHVTNGIHAASWISEEMSELYNRYLGPGWTDEISSSDIWSRIAQIPDEELWRVHERRRQRLVNFCRKRVIKQLEQKGATFSDIEQASQILDPRILTLGFARRFATYKRGTLLLEDPERFARILCNKERPVQIIMAGKAHPEDKPAKELIKQLIQFSRRDEEIRRRFVFIEDYEINVGRMMVSGADIWLNTPRRPLEACGTSGMKAIFNGVLNCSILDGWWDEAFEPNVGWSIGKGEEYADLDYQDNIESNELYELLEKEIVPAFYDRDSFGMPRKWLDSMKHSMVKLCPEFSVNRMLKDYTLRMYLPAMERYSLFIADGAKKAKEMAEWKAKIARKWNGVQILNVESTNRDTIKVGEDMKIKATIRLGGLNSDEVSVQIYHGPVDQYGIIREGEAIPMLPANGDKDPVTYSGTIRYFKSGRHGFSVRVLPQHEDLVSSFEVPLITWASDAVEVTA
ncbi:MAG: alpha-glucan family phosphorylase [Candidatus Melainabacteria bacterium]|nr:alpha-glucan family phosphorylase [Candidatus Melainabacteria bacterium]